MSKKQAQKREVPKSEEKVSRNSADAEKERKQRKKDDEKTVKAFCVGGFRVGPGEEGAVGYGEIIELSQRDFRRLKFAGKVIEAERAPKPKGKDAK